MPPGPAAGTDIGLVLSFYGLGGLTVLAAVLVVSLRNIFHAVLFLVLSFVGVAGLYVTLNAAFLAAVQVLIYAGAIAVLTLFAVFLTRDAMTQGNPPGRLRVSGLVAGVLVFVAFTYAFLNAQWTAAPATPQAFSPERLAEALFTVYVLPFEVASVLLLIAMIGAIVIARD